MPYMGLTTCFYVNGKLTLQWNYYERHGDSYSFKWYSFGMQDMVFRLLKDNLLHYKRMPLANLLSAGGNRKHHPTEIQ